MTTLYDIYFKNDITIEEQDALVDKLFEKYLDAENALYKIKDKQSAAYKKAYEEYLSAEAEHFNACAKLQWMKEKRAN